MTKKLILLTSVMFLCLGLNAQQERKAYMVSDAHFDTQWNWDVQTSIREYVRNTITQNLFLLDRYPDYVFNFEGAVKYWWMKEYYPEMYGKVKQYVNIGRWHITGSAWDANDVMVASPSSLIRNILMGQTYYRQEFGKEGNDIFLPDCFGFGWTLPTVAAHCGLLGFSSQKLQWRHKPFYENGGKFPFQTGIWQGIDGSQIMFVHAYDYTSKYKEQDLSKNEELIKLTDNDLGVVYHYYGTGDIGGSPTVESVRSIEWGINGNGPVKIISATADRLYKDYQPLSAHPELPVFNGELLMDVHGTGVYTSQAAMKLYNRQNEVLGDAAERAALAAETFAGEAYPKADFLSSWRRVIWHQFHDDLTGTSIPRAYEFSWNDELLGLKKFSDILRNSAKAVAACMNTNVKGTPVVLYNALGFDNADMVEICVPAESAPALADVTDASGRKVRAQVLGWADGKARVLVNASVPPVSFSVFDVSFSGKAKTFAPKKNVRSIENSVYAITLDDKGDIISIKDKRCGKELVAGGKAIRLAIFTHNPSYEWPAWEILKSTIDSEPRSIDGNVNITLVEDGALRKSICIEKTYGDSRFCQYIRLYEGNRADRIDFCNVVDWATSDALVKAEFPLSVSNVKATYDLGLGSVERGNNTDIQYEVPSHYWTDLTASDGSYGVTVLNDSRYGWDKPADNTIRLSLLHTPSTAGRYEYQNRQDYGHHEFTYSIIGHKGGLVKADAVQAGEKLNQTIKAFTTAAHSGSLGKQVSLLSCDNSNVFVSNFKKAEIGDEYALTVFETGGKQPQKANIKFAKNIVSAVRADGTEKDIQPALFAGNTLSIDITPFSVRTYKVKLAGAAKAELKSAPLALPYDLKVCSFNAFRGDADFSGRKSYPAELFPDELTCDGVPFTFGDKETNTGVICNGQTVALPEGGWNKVYLLAASRKEDSKAVFTCGDKTVEACVPNYTGFIGQWGHTGHTEGFLKCAEVAFVGTHQHSPRGDEPYEYTYMFKVEIPVPAGASSIVLPKDENVVVFSATAVNDPRPCAKTASTLFTASNK